MLFAVGDRRTPLGARLLALGALAYAVLPIDLLPDMAPLLGVTDDLFVVPVLLALAARQLPAPVHAAAQARSLGVQRRLPWLVPLLALLGLLLVAALGWWLWRGLSGLGG